MSQMTKHNCNDHIGGSCLERDYSLAAKKIRTLEALLVNLKFNCKQPDNCDSARKCCQKRFYLMIDGFFNEYRWLSNFHMIPIEYEGITYPSTEHAYQAAKTLDQADRRAIAALKYPGAAKKAGYKVKLREDWESIKLRVMEEVIAVKFQDRHLRQKLLDTGNKELVESNNWGDKYWGSCNGVGENHLGKILMKIRSNIKELNKIFYDNEMGCNCEDCVTH
jgi:N-glycosidase YbiA